MSEARSRRVFFALWPDDEATGHLAALAHSFAAEGGRAIRPVSLHLTLAFVGSVTPGQVEELERIAAGVRGWHNRRAWNVPVRARVCSYCRCHP